MDNEMSDCVIYTQAYAAKASSGTKNESSLADTQHLPEHLWGELTYWLPLLSAVRSC